MTNGLATDAAMDNWRGPAAFAVLDGPLAEVLGVRLDARAADCAACWRLLSGDERERADRFRYAEHRQHYIVARGSLRRLLADRISVEPEAIQFSVGEHGKPRLASAHTAANLEFNLSHSGSLALYAFARGCPVGVDVELVRDIPDADDLAGRFFSAAEIAALRALQPGRRSLAFLACWTRKEAFIKALGVGLNCPLDLFDVTIDPDTPARITRIGASADARAWALTAIRPYPGYIAALACRR